MICIVITYVLLCECENSDLTFRCFSGGGHWLEASFPSAVSKDFQNSASCVDLL
jgi:hypothetical protein